MAAVSSDRVRAPENAFAHYTRTFAPGRIKLRRLPAVAMMLHPDRRHTFAIFGAHTRHRHQKPHRHLCGNLSSRTCCCTAPGNNSTSARRRLTQLTLRSKRRANFSRVTEPLLHLRQQPALFQRALRPAEAQRAFEKNASAALIDQTVASTVSRPNCLKAAMRL